MKQLSLMVTLGNESDIAFFSAAVVRFTKEYMYIYKFTKEYVK